MSTSPILNVNPLVNVVLHREEMEVQLRRNAVSKGMYLERPELAAIMKSESGALDRYIAFHHSELAATAPKKWDRHVFGLKRDFAEQFQDAVSLDKTGFFFKRPIRADVPGWKMFDYYRAEAVLVAALPTFQTRFSTITGGAFKGLRFSNAVVSGGIVLACMTGDEADWQFFQDSDVDFFLYNTTPVEAQRFLRHLEKTLRRNVPNYDLNYHFTRTTNTFTFTPSQAAVASGFRKIQIITTIYGTIADIISHFDLAPCALAYDGQEVWMTARGLRSLWTGFTYVTDAIRGSSAARIMKYAQRGYALQFPFSEDINDDVRMRDLISDKSILPRNMMRRWKDKTLTTYRVSHLVCRAKFGLKGQWTHSLSGLVGLSVLWEQVQGQANLEKALIASTNGCGTLYGLYFESPEEPVDDIAEMYALAFLEMNFVSALAMDNGNFLVQGHTEALIHVHASMSVAYDKIMTMSVILPVGLRAPLSRLSKMRLNIVRGSRIVQDAYANDFELCVWELPPSKLWGPAPHRRTAAAIRILKKAVALTAWTVRKVHGGAPWNRINFGMTFAGILENDIDAALVREAHFQEWYSR
ncbi:hypothetical protein CF319_g4467 [Tilletia indica]|nr:hypothetical protein CF319_g4467 [Tilletia indica]